MDQGQSDSYESNYTQTVQVDLVKVLLDHLDIQKVHLVGISYGGKVALQFQIKYGHYLDRLLVYNSVAYTTYTLAETGHLWNRYAKEKDAHKYYEATIPVIYSKDFNKAKKEWMNEAVKQRNLVDVDWALANFNISNEPSLYQFGSNKLSNLKANTLIIWGDKDVTVPKIMFDETVRLLPEATVLVYENAGHSIVVDETEKLAIDIVHFIS